MFFRFRADSQARKAIAGATAGMVFTHGVMIPCRLPDRVDRGGLSTSNAGFIRAPRPFDAALPCELPMATVLVADQCEIPGTVASLDAFRRWARSPEFPHGAHIDWIGSCIEVDMSPEDIFTHGSLETESVRVLGTLAKARDMHPFTGETRVTSVAADLSVEPDVVAVSEATLASGRVRLVPAAGGRPERFVELEGGPDLVVEIVSDAAVRKDTQRLPAAYHATGVRELCSSMPGGRRCSSRSSASSPRAG